MHMTALVDEAQTRLLPKGGLWIQQGFRRAAYVARNGGWGLRRLVVSGVLPPFVTSGGFSVSPDTRNFVEFEAHQG